MEKQVKALGFYIYLTSPDNYWLFCVSSDEVVVSSYIMLPADIIRRYGLAYHPRLVDTVSQLIAATLQNDGMKLMESSRIFLAGALNDVTSNTLEDIDRLPGNVQETLAAGVAPDVIHLYRIAVGEYHRIGNTLGSKNLADLTPPPGTLWN